MSALVISAFPACGKSYYYNDRRNNNEIIYLIVVSLVGFTRKIAQKNVILNFQLIIYSILKII